MNQPTAPCSPPRTKNRTSRGRSERGRRPRNQNQTSGTTKATPSSRPQRRWIHSIQNRPWNPRSPMPGCRIWYWGICLYRANRCSQSAWDRGGRTPETGAHSMMDRPEPVRRVTPPSTTMTKIMKQIANSQIARSRFAERVAGSSRVSNGIGAHIADPDRYARAGIAANRFDSRLSGRCRWLRTISSDEAETGTRNSGCPRNCCGERFCHWGS